MLKFTMPEEPDNNTPNTSLPTSPAAEPLDMSLPPESKKEVLSRKENIKRWIFDHKKTSAFVAAMLIAIFLGAVPFSRYHLAAVVLKKNFSIRVIDFTTGQPVSNARVISSGLNAYTNASGVATLNLPVGIHQFKIDKKYYAGVSIQTLVPITGTKTVSYKLAATGRQVGVRVTDLLSGKPLSGVDIEVAGISAETDGSGKALLVLPAGMSKQRASLSLDGYNDADQDIDISNQKIAENDLALTPAGEIYFLSKRTGKLNVMKANLDGTNPEIVVAASGYEGVGSTALSQSPDGRYVVLEARRSAGDKSPQLYILSTSDDRLLTFDSGNFDFYVDGWHGDTVVYQATNNDMPDWQAGKHKVKSYDATTGKTTVLGSTGGTNPDGAAGESIDQVYLTAKKVVFNTFWQSNGTDDLNNHRNVVIAVDPNGQNKQTVASYNAMNINEYLYQYAPNSFYIQVNDSSSDKTNTTYYDYTVGGSFKKIDAPTNDQLYNNPVYYFSPQSDQTYWSEERDGKQTLITADAYGSASSQKVQALDYSAVGWYTGKYLVSTNTDNNELYIMALGGTGPVKVADYQSTYVY